MSELQRWLDWLGTPDCPCPTEWRPLGRLYGINMGKGWVRMATVPSCRYHGTSRREVQPGRRPLKG